MTTLPPPDLVPTSENARMIDLPRSSSVMLACCLLANVSASRSTADEPAGRPIVPGFERFYAGQEAVEKTVAGGRLLIGELNCASCHQGLEGSSQPIRCKQAPILDRVGGRIKVDHLRDYLADPRAVKPGTTMPNLLAKVPKAEAQAVVDALVHFLATTGTATETASNRKWIAKGKLLYEQVGCAACHGTPGDPSSVMATSVPLGDIGAKSTYQALTNDLINPLAARPSGRMPSMNLKEPEAQAIASFLLKDIRVDVPPNITYRYYEGDWDQVPDFEPLTPSSTGVVEDFDVEIAARHTNYALRFEGAIEVVRPGNYTFHLESDDGSTLRVDGKLVTGNDGVHARQAQRGRVQLTKGRHQVVVGYFQGGGQEVLDVEYEGPGVSRRSLASAIVPPEGAQPAASKLLKVASKFVPDPSKAEKGRVLFASIGCASCHQLTEGEKAIEPRPASKPLAELRADTGCLAADPPRGLPDFDLSHGQRMAIAAALKAPIDQAPGDREAIFRTMVAFNCYACHARDGVGGVEEGRDAAFATTQKEMGDEGRIPPTLTGVGGKLTESWLKHILADGAKDRPYMLTMMPRFGEANVGHLVGPLAAVDLVEPVPVPHFDGPERRVKATGRFIVGSQAFNCGSCHQFKEFQAAGIQALDMTLMARRLRRDWFHRYVVDPPAFRPGTRMPAAWPGGKSQLESIYDGDTLKQIESIWVYLSDGPNAAVPYGVGREPIPLVADKGAVLYRNFIQGAGSRAIGVGYPEKANLAFDANDLRIALIWQGAFIDASKHWTGRGEGFQVPLGDNLLNLPTGPTIAVLPSEVTEWPRHRSREKGDQFKGYRLVDGGRPVFQYDIGTIHVEDFPEGVSGGETPSIRRTIDLSTDQPSKGVYFRAATGKKIEPMGEGWFQVDSEWKVRLSADSKPFVRESSGHAELILPITLDGGKAKIVAEYSW